MTCRVCGADGRKFVIGGLTGFKHYRPENHQFVPVEASTRPEKPNRPPVRVPSVVATTTASPAPPASPLVGTTD